MKFSELMRWIKVNCTGVSAEGKSAILIIVASMANPDDVAGSELFEAVRQERERVLGREARDG